MLTFPSGVRPPRGRDGPLRVPHGANALHLQAKDVQLHIRKSNSCQTAVWNEGMISHHVQRRPLLTNADHLHLHPHPLH